MFPVHLPPLRERDGDVRILARHFLLSANREYGRYTLFGRGVLERLESYNWPGNIRQLENVIKRAVLIALDGNISVSDIESILRQESVINKHLEAGQAAVSNYPRAAEPAATTRITEPGLVAPVAASSRPYRWVREDEEEQLLNALQQTGGNKTRAAALLGMSARQFRYRLDKLELTNAP